MKCYTIQNGQVAVGIMATKRQLSPDITLDVIGVGEEGRGRKYSYIVVDPNALQIVSKTKEIPFYTTDLTLGNDPQRLQVWLDDKIKNLWVSVEDQDWKAGDFQVISVGPATVPSYTKPERKFVVRVTYHRKALLTASVGSTKAGNPKLIQETAGDSQGVIVVLRTGFGYRGSNTHLGDYRGWKCAGCDNHGQEWLLKDDGWKCPKCGCTERHSVYLPFPGTTLCRGIIADGMAGAMASGEQLITVLPLGSIFCTKITGRRCTTPFTWYKVTTEGTILGGFSTEDRLNSEVF